MAILAGEGLVKASAPMSAAPPPRKRVLSALSLSEWLDVTIHSFREFTHDRIAATAAGVTFYALLALFPAISAFVSLYGLMASVSDAERQVAALSGLVPGGALDVIGDEMSRLTQISHGALGVAFAVSLAISIWSANAGMKALIDGLNVAFETSERRGFVRLTLLSLAFTLGAIVLVAGGASLAVGAWLRWPLILAAVVVAFSFLYRLGPCRPAAPWRWITPGSVLAGVAWMATSGLFSWYVANFGHYDRTYGSLGAIVGFLTWIWISLMILLFGAEFDRETEKQAAR